MNLTLPSWYVLLNFKPNFSSSLHVEWNAKGSTFLSQITLLHVI
jgi:hypothetical protein